MIKYNFGMIAQTADDINQTRGRINGNLEDLKQQLQPLVTDWEGASSEAYQQAQLRWDRAAAELNEVLGQISVTVRQANDRMSQINTSAARSWA